MFKKPDKKKISIDFTEENYKIITEFAKKFNESNSSIVNYLISHFLPLDQTAKRMLARACMDSMEKEKQQFSSLGEYAKEEAHKRIKMYEDLILFFTEGKGYVLGVENAMRKIEILDGYVIFPNDWILIENQKPKDSRYVGVVEVKNGEEYNMPHFVFFSSNPIAERTNIEEEDILVGCQFAHPEFGKIKAMQVEPVYDENKIMINAELWKRSPLIGMFSIPTYGKDTLFPQGAMIVKGDKAV